MAVGEIKGTQFTLVVDDIEEVAIIIITGTGSVDDFESGTAAGAVLVGITLNTGRRAGLAVI